MLLAVVIVFATAGLFGCFLGIVLELLVPSKTARPTPEGEP